MDKWAGIIDNKEFQGQHKDPSFNSQISELPNPKGVWKYNSKDIIPAICERLEYEAISQLHNSSVINPDYHGYFWWKNWANSSIKQNESEVNYWSIFVSSSCSHTALSFSTMLINWQEGPKALKGVEQFLAQFWGFFRFVFQILLP